MDEKAGAATIKRRMGRPRGFDRDAALDVAERLFRRHGFEGVSIAQLVAALNIAAPSLYAAFGSKADLYREVVERYGKVDGAARADGEIGTAFDRISAALWRGVAAVTADPDAPGCMISTGMLAAGTDHAALAAEMSDRRTAFRRSVEKWIAADIDRGVLPAGTDAAGLARFFASVMQGLSVQAHDHATADDLAPVVEAALRAWPRDPVGSGSDVEKP